MRRPLKKTLAATVESTLRRAYELLPAGAKAALPRATVELVRSKVVAATLASGYDAKLWAGFSRQALADLARVKADAGLPARDRAEACLSLARWHASRGEFAAALKEAQDRRAILPRAARTRQHYMLEALILCRLGRAEEARALIGRYGARDPFDVSVQLMKANSFNPAVTGERTPQAEEKVLELVNTVYRRFGLAGIGKRDADAPLSIDNLRAQGVKARHDPQNKVTVIVPAYNAQDTISTTLTSIAAQSWRNIEALVVDDCSTDSTVAAVEAFCGIDDRFRLIRQDVNRGSYACRNRGLREATGRFVTVQDADDWSHPQRIEQQVVALLADPGRRYNLSRLVRATPDLAFFGAWRPWENLTFLDYSSLMFDQTVAETAGGWDEVRVSADKEFVKRLDLLLGGRHRDTVVSPCPMVFGRQAATSLTRSETTHVRTIHHGVRRCYIEVTDVWHASLKEAAAGGAAPLARSDLPVPRSIASAASPDERLDVVFVGDFNISGAPRESALEMLRAARAGGLRAGIFHYPCYDLDVTAPLRRDVIEYAAGNGVRIVCAGESVEADTVVVTHLPVLNHHLDMFPRMDHRRLVVVADETAGGGAAHDPAAVRRHLVEYFGHEGDRVPVSGTVRAHCSWEDLARLLDLPSGGKGR